MPVARTGSFGPIAPFIHTGDEGEALKIANDTDLGLAAAVFTRAACASRSNWRQAWPCQRPTGEWFALQSLRGRKEFRYWTL